MKLSAHRLEDLIPEHVFSALSRKEVREVRRFVSSPFRFVGLDFNTVSNRGLWFVGMSTFSKYEVLRSRLVGDGDILELLAFDSGRVDSFFRTVQPDSQVALFEQHLCCVVYALTNSNLSGATAESLLLGVVDSGLRVGLAWVSVADLLGERFFERFGKDDLSAEVADRVGDFFVAHNFPVWGSMLKG